MALCFKLIVTGGGMTAGEVVNVMAQAIAAGMTANDIALS
jgi:hypothetical protein